MFKLITPIRHLVNYAGILEVNPSGITQKFNFGDLGDYLPSNFPQEIKACSNFDLFIGQSFFSGLNNLKFNVFPLEIKGLHSIKLQGGIK